MEAQAAGRKIIKTANGIVDITVLTAILLLLAFAIYALWDAHQIYRGADKSNYAAYKPTATDEGKSFKDLQTINGDVFAWLTVYGTNIDYPVTQGQDNMKYVNTNAEGLYSLSGSIFLDSHNKKDFSDFNSIIYGHHMEKKTMFGEIGEFTDPQVFEGHRYGNLYFNEKDHGVEFFAFIHADAYDSAVFTPNVEEGARQAYLGNLLTKALFTRDIGVSIDDHIILLSTCSSSSTNGRDILAGRISNETYEDPYANEEGKDDHAQEHTGSKNGFVEEVSPWLLLLMILLLLLALRLGTRVLRRRQKRR